MKISASIRRTGGLRLMQKALDWESEPLRAAVNEAARTVRNIARQLIRAKDKSGRGYYRPRGEGHQKYRASRPGEPPARFTGHLVEHVRMYPAKKGRTRAVAWVGSTSPHVHLLEYGTRTMAPRPFMGPAARAAKDQNYQNIKKASRQTVKAAAQRARTTAGRAR